MLHALEFSQSVDLTKKELKIFFKIFALHIHVKLFSCHYSVFNNLCSIYIVLYSTYIVIILLKCNTVYIIYIISKLEMT